MRTIAKLLFCAPILAFGLTAQAAVLYNGSLGTLPEAQGSLNYAQDAAVATKAVDNGTTVFDTGAAATHAGWTTFPNPVPTLNRATGFTLGFDVKIASEAHSSTDRAGFSVILLSSDHQGVELGFWPDQIFAQNVGFTKGENVATNTTAAVTHYDLSILGTNYTLSAGNSQILTGSVRDYVAPSLPYQLNNYVFLGDDTTSATASIVLSGVTLAVPEPTGLVLLTGLMGLMCRRTRSNTSH